MNWLTFGSEFQFFRKKKEEKRRLDEKVASTHDNLFFSDANEIGPRSRRLSDLSNFQKFHVCQLRFSARVKYKKERFTSNMFMIMLNV